MNQKCRKKKTFKELEDYWYQKLRSLGFEDIENTSSPDRPLKEWHSRKFTSERSQFRREERERYQEQISDFLNAIHIDEICTLIVKHGNSSLTPKKVKKILELHRSGLTERAIAKKFKRDQRCIHMTLKKAREWMKVA